MLNVKSGLVVTSLLMLAAVGCGDDTGSGGDAAGGAAAGGNGTGGDGDGGTAADPFAQYYACEETTFEDQKPMSGPGIDADGNLIGEPQATYFVHTTQIYVSDEQEPAFFDLVGGVIGQLTETPGLVGYALGGDEACLVSRTMGIWESEEAMYAFVASGAHGLAMGELGAVSITGKTSHWTATGEEVAALTSGWSVTSWDEARARLDEVEPLEGY